jgi:hypothetical protein
VGFVHAVVRAKHVCRAAPDLRVTAQASPSANRVGGTFTYRIAVTNVGRRSAPEAVLVVEANADLVSASSSLGACSAGQGRVRARCALGLLGPRALATVTVTVRGTTLGELRLALRTSSSSRDARPGDNVANVVTHVTDPDFVRGRGVRPAFGPGARPPVVVEVDAISGPGGEDPVGTFYTKYPVAPELRGRVTCLTTSGNRASVGGIVEETTDPVNDPVGSTVHFAFTDNGEPGVGRDTTATYLKAWDASTCPVPLQEVAPELALIEGNFVVHDEQGY